MELAVYSCDDPGLILRYIITYIHTFIHTSTTSHSNKLSIHSEQYVYENRQNKNEYIYLDLSTPV